MDGESDGRVVALDAHQVQRLLVLPVRLVQPHQPGQALRQLALLQQQLALGHHTLAAARARKQRLQLRPVRSLIAQQHRALAVHRVHQRRHRPLLLGILLLDAVLAQRRQVGHQKVRHRVAKGAVQLLDALEGHGVARARAPALPAGTSVGSSAIMRRGDTAASMNLSSADAHSERLKRS